jgi:hypothetical protein
MSGTVRCGQCIAQHSINFNIMLTIYLLILSFQIVLFDMCCRETNNFLEGEKQEMIEIYMGKGLSEEDATNIITTMAKYKDFFVDHMLVMELGLMPVSYIVSVLGLIICFTFCVTLITLLAVLLNI